MTVTRSNEHAPDKSSRFLGICIQRLGAGLRAEFTLRNVVEGLGNQNQIIVPILLSKFIEYNIAVMISIL